MALTFIHTFAPHTISYHSLNIGILHLFMLTYNSFLVHNCFTIIIQLQQKEEQHMLFPFPFVLERHALL